MAGRKETAEKIWQQLKEKMTSAQRNSLQRLNDAFDACKEDPGRGRYNELRISLVLAAVDGVPGFVPVKTIAQTNPVLGTGESVNGQFWYVLCTSPEEAVLCPEETLTCVKLDTIVMKAIRDQEFAGLWLNPYGGHKFSVSREDLALYRAMADLGVLNNCFHEAYCDRRRPETEDGKPKRFGDRCNSGTACVLVYEKGIGDSHHPFWNWLREEGFHSWGCHGNFGMNWVFINLNSMEYAPGMPGIRIASPIREHAITMREFITIWHIYRKYDGLGPLIMPETEQTAGEPATMKGRDETAATDLSGPERDQTGKTGAMPRRTVSSPRTDDTFSMKYIRALMERVTSDQMLNEHNRMLAGKAPAEQKRIKDRLALDILAECPYKPLIELDYRDQLREKHIDERNWLRHLDEMTDEEITFMMEQLPGKDSLNRNRQARPEISDRIRAEFLRDF